MLAEHPEVLCRLRREILEKIGPQRRPTYDDFKDMKFLKAVINGALCCRLPCRLLTFGTETLRLYPVVYVILLWQLHLYIDRLLSVLSTSGIQRPPISSSMSTYSFNQNIKERDNLAE